MIKHTVNWKYPTILLVGIGVSHIGEWVYFIALNLIVLDSTGSPLAVSLLYLMRPIATLLTNAWAGGVIDRLNNRNVMIFLDLFRSFFIFLLPFISSMVFIYLIVLIINMASAMFGPTSMTYITKLIPRQLRPRFNSLYSLITSGAFLVGPAIAGILFMFGTPEIAIVTNGVALLLSGMITCLMPKLDEEKKRLPTNSSITFVGLQKDWSIVLQFSVHSRYILIIYFLFNCIMAVLASAVDSLEAAFAKGALELSNMEYGFLVSIAGAGIGIGALCINAFIHKISVTTLIGFGTVFVSLGYVLYASSHSFLVASIGFFVLAYFTAFANTGFLTFFQNNIPVEKMGRISSVYQFVDAVLIILTTVGIGMYAHFSSVKVAVFSGTSIMLFLALLLCVYCLQSHEKKYSSD
ncbi:Major Facilitator Superfamily protein [Oceanobacillus limi]|uniref:Major Facilitator Superfamily protein n=1 Tax=Oceanobacillus limi TaxID=930131 RepID=A0A1I0CE01_9BACI|nr:MFS transporter [Oceanobacillus limi]SET17801.1 Major Facilitator Superfamily protein [Oceanobacillus limi]